ncbi:MAG TPA: hypothetical protein VG477_17265 [Thermoanaerobaculia bacterium]|nr:hypothetical protein [Thermoanaerobaculia bacterium]
MRLLLPSLGLLAMTAGCHAPPPRSAAEIVPHRLGDTEITFAVHSGDGAGPAFLVLHDNEDTAVEAGLETIQSQGGRLVEVRARGSRLVSFELAGQTWRFDPNRVFTDAGAEATLRSHSAGSPSEVLAEVRRFADAVLAVYGVDSTPVVVTLHNNTEGEYSAASYMPGGGLAYSAAAVHLPAGADPDDFFFVTDRGLYDAIVLEGFPAVLQDNTQVTDDGSLSVWAGRRGVPYVNIEARHGNRERQVEMLGALVRILQEARLVGDALSPRVPAPSPSTGSTGRRR